MEKAAPMANAGIFPGERWSYLNRVFAIAPKSGGRGGCAMAGLSQEKCVACRADALRVTESEIVELKPQVPQWELRELDGIPRIERTYRFKNFAGALDFTVKVGELAESEGHHPAILTEWGKVTVTYWTHAIRGLHRNDFIMAARTDVLYGS